MQDAGDRKSPGTAVVLSALWPGLGHIYLGQLGIGLPLSVATGAAAAFSYQVWDQARWYGASSFSANQTTTIWTVIGVSVVLWLWSIWHSRQVASTATATDAPNGAIPKPPAGAQNADVGEQTWQLIQASGDKAMLEEFVRRFPDHPRVLMAKVALQRVAVGNSMGASASTGNSALSSSSGSASLARQTGMAREPTHVDVQGLRKDSSVVVVAAVLIALFVGGIGWFYSQHNRAPQPSPQPSAIIKPIEPEPEVRVRSGGPAGQDEECGVLDLPCIAKRGR
jgi:hypothetical protein